MKGVDAGCHYEGYDVYKTVDISAEYPRRKTDGDTRWGDVL